MSGNRPTPLADAPKEMGVQALIPASAWGIKGIRAKTERRLRDALLREGCTNIIVEPPRYEFLEPEPDAEEQFEPEWVWEFNAVGEKVSE